MTAQTGPWSGQLAASVGSTIAVQDAVIDTGAAWAEMLFGPAFGDEVGTFLRNQALNFRRATFPLALGWAAALDQSPTGVKGGTHTL
jgi:hypothetical protein